MTASHFIRSLFVSTVLSFLMPVISVASIFALAFGIRYIPDLDMISQIGVQQIYDFLSVFGSGNPLHGVVVIGITFGLVGGLFDTFALYRHQRFKGFDP